MVLAESLVSVLSPPSFNMSRVYLGFRVPLLGSWLLLPGLGAWGVKKQPTIGGNTMKKSKSHLSLTWKLDVALNVPIDPKQAADMANRLLLAASVVTLTLGVAAAFLLAGS